ncbi:MAG: DNA alkylation repair protein [Paludibacter sp.]
MKYSFLSPTLEAQTTEILRQIRLSMNGIASEQMTKSGLIYKKNYGVSIPRIKEIASLYTPNHELAQQLWILQIRETMIMATLLEPIDKFTYEMAIDWMSQFNQIEIIEQSNMNLFSKLSYSDLLCQELITNKNNWFNITGFILAARIFEKLSDIQTKNISEQAIRLSETTDLHLYKAIGLCLSRFCRKNKEIATYIMKEIDSFSDKSSVSQQYISSEVKQELLFLDFL